MCILFVNVIYKNGNSVTLETEVVYFPKNTTTNLYCMVLELKKRRPCEQPP